MKMKKLDEYLTANSELYRKWHESEIAQSLHWLIFFFIAISITSSLLGNISQYGEQNLAQVATVSTAFQVGDSIRTSASSVVCWNSCRRANILWNQLVVEY